MQHPTMNALLLLALTSPFLANPVPNRGITVRYDPNYANPPAPRSSLPQRDTLEEDIASLSPTPSASELDDILSIQRPLPSSVLMNLARLRGEEGEEGEQSDEGVSRREDGQAAEENAERPALLSDRRHFCPIAGLVVFSVLSFLACAIQRYVLCFEPGDDVRGWRRMETNWCRWRKPRGEIYLDVEKPQRHSISLRADEEVAEAK